MATVLYNSAGALPQYAAALAPSVADGLARVITVDNASPDESAALIRRLLPEATQLSNTENLGFAGGVNQVWPLVETRYWLLLNPDVHADKAGLERLITWMDAHPSVAVASPRLRLPSGEALDVARAHDTLWRPVLELLRLHKLFPTSFRARWLLSGRNWTPELINGWVPGAAMIVRCSAVEGVGLLNEELFMYGEDREWCWRMSAAGWEVGVCTEVEFVHASGTSAMTTWTEQERRRREVAGHLAATRRLRGERWARAFAFVAGLALVLESCDPRRVSAARSEARQRGGLYLRASRSPAPGHPPTNAPA